MCCCDVANCIGPIKYEVVATSKMLHGKTLTELVAVDENVDATEGLEQIVAAVAVTVVLLLQQHLLDVLPCCC